MHGPRLALCLTLGLAACGAPPAPGASLPPGEYACVWVNRGAAFQTALSFNVTGPGRYANTENSSRGTFEVHAAQVVFHGGPFDGMTGEALHDGQFTIDRKRCAPVAG